MPDFLLPGKIIRSDFALKTVEETRDPLNLDLACSILGCIDFRTARKYLENGYLAIKKACVSLAEKLTLFPGCLNSNHFTPDTHIFSSFRTLVNRFNLLQTHIYGSRGYILQCRDYVFLGSHWEKDKPTTYVSDSDSPPDTT